MIASIILGLLIFGYATWMVVSFFKKSRQGKCGTCALNKSCKSGCSIVTAEERGDLLKHSTR
ncbi:FeoB-associated Cys-rich membrane protein [Bacillus sp. FJAT-42376]|uniref:FeoB-associated Cys-rich membrane protein n=1 Tax=Bacillus sp. FJAT-42376 TaxID=2014076 RepID=UPI000F4F7F5D|nr:FeoB-associated Cys-rich membrane protein [Bacillus sp. FJAT-42376]AZB41057.1 FeoB-associated Cys-rich membrane protein [Bacillus sp. FJAT-42376]